jgi:hypothetical protein
MVFSIADNFHVNVRVWFLLTHAPLKHFEGQNEVALQLQNSFFVPGLPENDPQPQ